MRSLHTTETTLATDDSGGAAQLDQKTFQAMVMMLRAKAMARRGDVHEAVNVAKTAADGLADRATPENYWSAFVATDGLLDLALHMSAAGSLHETIALNQAGSAIGLRHVADAPDVWAPILANHMVCQAQTHMRLCEHEAAATLLENSLGFVRGLPDGPEEERELVAFDIRPHPTSPSRYESLDEVLSMYIGELQRLDRTADLLTALAELVDLRRRRGEADEQVDHALSYAWIARIHASALIDTDQPEAAATVARTALAVAKDIPAIDNKSQEIRAAILHDAAIVLIRADAVHDAVTSISACVEIYRTDYEPSAHELASSLDDLPAILNAAGQTEESATAGGQALDLWRDLAARDIDELQGLAICLHNQALNREKAGREDEARELRAELEALRAQEAE